MIDLLSKVKNLGIRLWVEDGVLKYKAPNGLLDEGLKKQIGEHKTKIIAFLTEGRGAPLPPILPVSRTGELPLSQGQRWLWIASLMGGSESRYNIPAAFRLLGSLDIGAFRGSLNAIVARHEVLRTGYELRSGNLCQFIQRELSLDCPLTDLRDFPPQEQDRIVRESLHAEMETAFDLKSGRVLRARLLRLSEREHILLLCFHHIACDNQSLHLFLREMTELYQAEVLEQPLRLSPLSVQYADYAAWQARFLTDGAKDRQLAFWRSKLRDLEGFSEIAWDFPRPPESSHRSHRRNFLLEPATEAALRAASRGQATSLFTTLLAIVKLLLFRYARKKTLAIGVPVSGRPLPELEDLIGLFFNTVVIRSEMDEELSFPGWLERVKSAVNEAFSHQELPFESLVEELKPQREGDRPPYFQVLFNMYAARYERTVGALAIEPYDRDSIGGQNLNSKFDLTILAIEHEKGLQLDFSFKADLFESRTADWLVTGFRELLTWIALRPEIPLRELPAPSLAVRTGARLERGKPAFERPEIGLTLVDRFEKIARENGARVAVEGEGLRLTYSELKAEVDLWNGRLRGLGLDGDRVALLAGRGPLTLAVLFGVLKSSNAFVFLDPDYPLDRQKHILLDSGARVLVTDGEHEELSARLAAETGIALFPLKQRGPGEAGDELNHAISGNPAYLVYTSGSTGLPKGVMQTHRNVLHYIMNYSNGLGLGPRDVLSLIPSFSFSAALMDVFAALCNGAKLCLYDIKKQGVTGLGPWLSECGVTVYHSVPTVFRHFAEALGTGVVLPSVRVIDLGGEAVSRREVELFRSHFSDRCVLVNGLGATELNVIRQFVMDHGTEFQGESVPVGYEVDDTAVTLLDEAGEPVGFNQIGEILIESQYLAPGYWNQPELTHAAFETRGEGVIRYRSGDLGRLRPDGCLEHLGRKDLQVKIRGIRIEPGEIESVLRQLPGVGEAVVAAQERPEGGKELVAYLIPNKGAAAPDPAQLRELARTKLPDFMLPSQFCFLDAFPLTSTGKIDRRALKPVSREAGRSEEAQDLPINDAERQLMEIWKSAMRLDRLGRHDHFFRIGGDSLIALRVVDLARQAGFSLNPRLLASHPTIAGLAQRLSLVRNDKPDASPEGSGSEVRMLPNQINGIEFRREQPHINNFTRLVEIRKSVDEGLLRLAVGFLCRHHEVLRVRFLPGASGWEQVLVREGEVEIPVTTVDRNGARGQELQGLLEKRTAEFQASLDITRGPLFRIVLFRGEADEPAIILIIVHHLIMDGYSFSTFFQDLFLVYRCLAAGAESSLPELPTSYGAYAEALYRHAHSAVIAQEIPYWMKKTAGYLPIKKDFSEERPLRIYDRHFRMTLDPQETKILLSRCSPILNATFFELILAAFYQVLFEHSGREALTLGIMTRQVPETIFPDLDISRTVGDLAYRFPLRLSDAQVGNWWQRTEHLRDEFAELPHDGIGYELLARVRKAPEIAASYLGPYDVLFNYTSHLSLHSYGLSDEVKFLTENNGSSFHPDHLNLHAVYVHCGIDADRFHFMWRYNLKQYRPETIENLGKRWMELLSDLARNWRDV